MTKFDGDPAEAEASLRRASEALSALQDELAVAEEPAEAIEQEETPATPEAEADVTQRMEIVQREIEASVVDQDARAAGASKAASRGVNSVA
jgi:DNA primase